MNAVASVLLHENLIAEEMNFLQSTKKNHILGNALLCK